MKFLKNFIIVSVVSLAIQAVASTNAMSFESIKGMGEYTYEGKFKKKNYSTYQEKAKEKIGLKRWGKIDELYIICIKFINKIFNYICL